MRAIRTKGSDKCHPEKVIIVKTLFLKLYKGVMNES